MTWSLTRIVYWPVSIYLESPHHAQWRRQILHCIALARFHIYSVSYFFPVKLQTSQVPVGRGLFTFKLGTSHFLWTHTYMWTLHCLKLILSGLFICGWDLSTDSFFNWKQSKGLQYQCSRVEMTMTGAPWRAALRLCLLILVCPAQAASCSPQGAWTEASLSFRSCSAVCADVGFLDSTFTCLPLCRCCCHCLFTIPPLI